MPLHRNRVAALLALLAVALQALWPLLAQARPLQGGIVVPLCTVEGITHYLELPPASTPLEERSSSHHEHCQLCLSGAERLATLPAAVSLQLIGTIPAWRILAVGVRQHESPFYRPAQPRAPPIAS